METLRAFLNTHPDAHCLSTFLDEEGVNRLTVKDLAHLIELARLQGTIEGKKDGLREAIQIAQIAQNAQKRN